MPASLVGRQQEIEIGPMCGESNVVFWLRERGIEPDGTLVQAIFARAKSAERVLETREVLAVCREHGVEAPEAAPPGVKA